MNIISSILQDLLNILFGFTGDIGISIVIITLLVKLLLIPLTVKQKTSIIKQQDMVGELEELKEKYKSNSKELEKQMKIHATKNVKSMLGCFVILLQMPILFALYNTFLNLPSNFSSLIVPWISNLSMSDDLYIIPCIYSLTMLAPSLINYIPYFKNTSKVVFNKQMAVMTTIISFVLTARTPVAIGIYFITSSSYSFIEDMCFRIYLKSKNKLKI
jgi:YidC/Oxa1 family membrane protein insertase